MAKFFENFSRAPLLPNVQSLITKNFSALACKDPDSAEREMQQHILDVIAVLQEKYRFTSIYKGVDMKALVKYQRGRQLWRSAIFRNRSPDWSDQNEVKAAGNAAGRIYIYHDDIAIPLNPPQ